jgi:hypothetical protein
MGTMGTVGTQKSLLLLAMGMEECPITNTARLRTARS